MSLDGLVSSSLLFHDRGGTASLKVVSLSSGKSVASGKVAAVTGTVGTAVISYGPLEGAGFLDGYRDASGDLVGFSSITGFALKSDGSVYAKQSAQSYPSIVSDGDEVSYTRVVAPDVGEYINVAKTSSGTCNFTLVIYGE